MLTIKNIAAATLALITLVIFLTLVDFLALHDIQQDYVSREVFSWLDVELSSPLPAWTNTDREWTVVTISLVTRLALLSVNTALLILLLMRTSNGANARRQSGKGDRQRLIRG